jgi:hypothetical protein
MKEDKNKMNEVVQYLDSLIITINLKFNMPISKRHPCQKEKKKLHNDQQDYIDLINKL